MILMMIRSETGPHEMLKGELENDAKGPGQELTEWQPKKVQLSFSQGKKKKGDEVDDDVMRTKVSQDRVKATLGTEELFLHTQYSSLHI
jgi:hypothetical protein